MLAVVESIGSVGIRCVEDMGRFGRFMSKTIAILFTPPFKFRRFVQRIHFIGSKSHWLIVLIGTFTGAVLGLQVYYTLVKFGAQARVGTVVSLSLIRELGPVICALMVAGRAGSSLASEIGIMQISEQIDALKIMGLDPYRYFMAPILAAGVVSVFLLTAIFDVVGILGGYAIVGGLLGVPYGSYFGGITEFLNLDDIINGAVKSMVFGFFIAWVSCYKGYHTGHGAEGVSRASTETVVLSSVLILISDYVMTSVMFK